MSGVNEEGPKDKGDEKDMATETILKPFYLDEEMAKKIISAPRTVIKESGVYNDLKVSKSERLANAKRILNSRKCK